MPKAKRSTRKHSRRAETTRRRVSARADAPPVIEGSLADLAHEIRTPLTGILSMSELLATSGLGERERGWANAIKSTAEHLAMLTSLIVDAARAQAKGLVLRRELIRPRRLAQALAASLAGRAEAKGLASETSISSGLPDALLGDPLRLRAALENLIDNAVKFTHRGSVRLDVTCRRVRRGKMQLLFAVSDTGIGLTAAEIRRLYRPFSQANPRIARRYGGAGLGLAFVKRIAKAMGGDLAVAAEPGGGTRFRFHATLDEVAQTPGAAQGGGAAAGTASLPALDILCVEDNPYGRVLLNAILTELGHHADFVGTGTAALDAVARRRYDAVLMDVTLPDFDGVEATRRIRALAGAPGRVPVVGVSGRADAANEAAGREAGMDGYLTKPLSPSALKEVLGSLARPVAPIIP